MCALTIQLTQTDYIDVAPRQPGNRSIRGICSPSASRTGVDHMLYPDQTSITLNTMAKVAHYSAREYRVLATMSGPHRSQGFSFDQWKLVHSHIPVPARRSD